jgi:multicomponent Na+:H+ antiporter subunit C
VIGLSAIVVGVLFASSLYLLLSRNVQRVAIGFIVLSNGVNLLVLTAAGVPDRAIPPLIGGATEGTFADPLPQAFILTAIVIGLGTAAFITLLMTLCNKRFTAMQYALFSSLMTVPGKLLGMGSGWMEKEHDAFGFTLDAPGARLDLLAEQAEIVVRQWTEDRFDHTGAHYRLEDCRADPKPPRIRTRR